MSPDDMVLLYGKARFILTAAERLGRRVPWPDRPESVPADFGEATMAELGQQIRDTWPDDTPESMEMLNTCLEDIDRGILHEVDRIGTDILRQFLRGGSG